MLSSVRESIDLVSPERAILSDPAMFLHIIGLNRKSMEESSFIKPMACMHPQKGYCRAAFDIVG